MIVRQRIVTFGIATTAVATIALALWMKPWASESLTTPSAGKPPVESAKHRIDVVFAVDTTGSMGGLIDGAKRTVWSIASHIREIDKQADLHVGLVAYRDLGDDYVTRDFALTADLDSVFAELSSYQAAGGGDAPEDVDAALYDAVHKMQWRDGAKKMIFLVGDAPPASRGEVPKFEVTAHEAADLQIKLNTIRCGVDGETQTAWQQIASIGHGEFSTIEQNGGVQQIATPYDDKLAALSATVDSTTVIYGDASAHRGWEGKMEATKSAAPAAAADRAGYYAAKPSKKGEGRAKEDIVGGVATGAVSVETLTESNLPADMQGMSKDQLKNEFDRRAKVRDEAQKEISELAKQRAEYLRTHDAGKDGFDAKVKATVEHELK
jgi:von Willebrand factor type A domain